MLSQPECERPVTGDTNGEQGSGIRVQGSEIAGDPNCGRPAQRGQELLGGDGLDKEEQEGGKEYGGAEEQAGMGQLQPQAG
jgi:hypothetical protein